MASSIQSVDYASFESGVKDAIVSGGAAYSSPPDADKFSYAFVAPKGQVLLRGKESEKAQDMTAAAIGKCKRVIADKSEAALIDPAEKYGGCGMCCVLCCMIPPTLCCGAPLNIKGAVPVKMDNGEIGSFAVAGSNDCRRDREQAVKALQAVGFTEDGGIFAPPAQSTA